MKIMYVGGKKERQNWVLARMGAMKGFPRASHTFAVPTRFTINLVDLKSITDYSTIFIS